MLSFARPASPQQQIFASNYGYNWVSAAFSSLDSSGCVNTMVYIWAGGGGKLTVAPPSAYAPPPGSSVQPSLMVQINSYDFCAERATLDAESFGYFTGSLTIARDLSSAALSTPATVTDTVSGVAFPITINVKWAGTGTTYHQNTNYQFSEAKRLIGLHYEALSFYRAGTAAGTVSDATHNYTPNPTSLGVQLNWNSTGFIEIGGN
jgi:hypothetical protein